MSKRKAQTYSESATIYRQITDEDEAAVLAKHAEPEPEVCACGHDDVTHALRLIGGWGKCLASLDDGWECKCPKFVPPLSAAEIKAAQARARAELEAEE